MHGLLAAKSAAEDHLHHGAVLQHSQARPANRATLRNTNPRVPAAGLDIALLPDADLSLARHPEPTPPLVVRRTVTLRARQPAAAIDPARG
jgi:hypothetical protein